MVFYLSRDQFARVCASEGVPVAYSLYAVDVEGYGGERVRAVTLRTASPHPCPTPRALSEPVLP